MRHDEPSPHDKDMGGLKTTSDAFVPLCRYFPRCAKEECKFKHDEDMFMLEKNLMRCENFEFCKQYCRNGECRDCYHARREAYGKQNAAARREKALERQAQRASEAHERETAAFEKSQSLIAERARANNPRKPRPEKEQSKKREERPRRTAKDLVPCAVRGCSGKTFFSVCRGCKEAERMYVLPPIAVGNWADACE